MSRSGQNCAKVDSNPDVVCVGGQHPCGRTVGVCMAYCGGCLRVSVPSGRACLLRLLPATSPVHKHAMPLHPVVFLQVGVHAGQGPEMHSNSTAMVPVALAGFRRAKTRHTDPAAIADPTSVFLSATEAVFWAAILDEQLRDRGQYMNFLRGDPIGSLMPGVRYIRNLKTHSLTMTIRRITGKIYPIVYPTTGFEVLWLPFAALPPPRDRNRYTEVQENSYRDHMAGRPTRQTLLELDEGFARLEDMPNSPVSALLPVWAVGDAQSEAD